MFEVLKRKVHLFVLNRLKKNKGMHVVPEFGKLKAVAIVFNVGDESVWSLLSRYAQVLERNGCSVWMLGFQPRGVEIDYIIANHHAILCNEKTDVSALGLPKHAVLGPFFQEQFDILVDATGYPNFFSQYVALHSKARFTVSYNNTTISRSSLVDALPVTEIFDFSISGGGKIDIRHFLSNIEQYLKMFN